MTPTLMHYANVLLISLCREKEKERMKKKLRATKDVKEKTKKVRAFIFMCKRDFFKLQKILYILFVLVF